MGQIPGLFPSPLRYPGGKGKIANYIKLLMLENDLVGLDYVEPFAGGASVALSLLYEGFADEIHINDLNPGVHAFWHAVLHDTDHFCEIIAETPVTVEEWQNQRQLLSNPAATPLETAFATFFMNRCNRSGIIAGGIIGGLQQTGPYLIDARYNKVDLTQRIRKVARHRNRIHLTKRDAAEYLNDWSTEPDTAALIYLDPPYFVKGEGLYDNFYGPNDHEQIAHIVGELRGPWVVTYDAVPEIVALYAGHKQRRYDLSYSASAQRSRGAELMIFSDDIEPPASRPSCVPAKTVLQAQTVC